MFKVRGTNVAIIGIGGIDNLRTLQKVLLNNPDKEVCRCKNILTHCFL